MGLRYAKYILLTGLIVFDFLILFDKGVNYILNEITIRILFGIQGMSLFIYTLFNIILIKMPYKNESQYSFRDILYFFLLNIYTIPAFVWGSLLGLFRNSGSFYCTTRNEYNNQ